MLNTKIAISSFIFVLILVGAWHLDNQMDEQRSKQLNPASLQHYKIYSAHDSIHQLEPFSPYLPREYMRIIQFGTQKKPTEKSQ
ncbi:hypothetical protein [Bacillus sp. FJAT-28004]|uniref:hypothetical protein n=1 Tax=Bacillus sp. FJAT-28004 TaxID=1679165 RepID=UPI00128FBA87|nr:hypothetical protein [Bacillus sp. FJAT-28004]